MTVVLFGVMFAVCVECDAVGCGSCVLPVLCVFVCYCPHAVMTGRASGS